MNTLEKISKLLEQQNKKQKDLTDFLGITKNSFSNWKSGNNNSYIKYIGQIADFLGVSADYLLGNETEQATKKPLSENEERLKELYELTDGMSDAEIMALKAFVAGLKANRKPD